MISDLLDELEREGKIEQVTGPDAEYENRAGNMVRDVTAWRPKPVQGNEGGAAGTASASDSDYHSADWFASNHGIRPARLSEKRRDGEVRTKDASKGYTDVEGKKPRLLYNVADALKHCSPKHVTQKTRRKLGLGDP